MAEVRKRGDDFWQEFEFYLSDLLVGIVLDVALVSLMAPVAVIAGVSKAASATGRAHAAYAAGWVHHQARHTYAWHMMPT